MKVQNKDDIIVECKINQVRVPDDNDACAEGSEEALQRHEHAQGRQHHDRQDAITL